MAHPVPIKSFLWMSPEIAILSQPSVDPIPHPALSVGTEPKSQGRSDITIKLQVV